MKTRIWVFILLTVFLLSAFLGFFLLRDGAPSYEAQIYSQGKYLKTVSLSEDKIFTITLDDGSYNRIYVKDGRIAVVEASCPDHHCMNRGYVNSGASVICLPNALEIRFTGSSGPDLSTR